MAIVLRLHTGTVQADSRSTPSVVWAEGGPILVPLQHLISASPMVPARWPTSSQAYPLPSLVHVLGVGDFLVRESETALGMALCGVLVESGVWEWDQEIERWTCFIPGPPSPGALAEKIKAIVAGSTPKVEGA